MWVQSHLSSSFRQKLTIISCQQKHVREVSYEKLVQLTTPTHTFFRSYQVAVSERPRRSTISKLTRIERTTTRVFLLLLFYQSIVGY